MFKFKRNFSIRESPTKRSSGSPVKFSTTVPTSPIKFVDDTLKPRSLLNSIASNGPEKTITIGETSPLRIASRRTCTPEILGTNGYTSPIKPIANGVSHQLESTFPNDGLLSDSISEFDMDFEISAPNKKRMKLSMDQIKAQKEAKLLELNEQVENKKNSIFDTMKKTNEIREKRSVIEDYLNIVTQSQLQVRNHLNRMYNPGREIAECAKELITEKRQAHDKKLEALTFELTELLESSHIALERKAKQLSHEIELHERTLYTLESRQLAENMHKKKLQQEEEQQQGEPENDKNVSDNENVNVECLCNVEFKDESHSIRFEPDDDCVIIEKQGAIQQENKDNEVSYEKSNKLEETRDSQATNLAEDDEQATTDVEEESELNEDERPFTPCQAQRPQ